MVISYTQNMIPILPKFNYLFFFLSGPNMHIKIQNTPVITVGVVTDTAE